MVIEGVVVSILKKYIGKYIENFNGKNLSLSLWSGEATLCDLELKAEALAELNMPIQVTSGYIGKLSLSIPWSSIYTQSVIVKIEDIFVVASPQIELPYDEEQDRKFSLITKHNQLNFITNLKEKKRKENPVVENSNDTLMEKLTAQVIKNIQIFISNIHVRYEDKTSNPSSPFAFGLTLNELTAQTTDENWLPTIVDGSVQIIYKMIKASNLSVYWNTNISHYVNGLPNWKSFMRNQINTADKINPQEFIIKPLLFAVELKIDQDAKVLMGLPKFLLDVVLKELSIEVTKNQFESLINLVEAFERMAINSIYRKYKPKFSVKESPKLWWKYMFESFIETSYKCWTWERIKQHRANYRSYVSLYKEKLKDDYLFEKRNWVYENCEISEELLDVANILIARKQAMNEFNIEKENGILKSPEKSEKPIGWLEWFGITSSSSSSLQDKKIIEKASMLSLVGFSEEEKNELYHAIGYTEDGEHPVYSKEYVRSQISLHLETSSIILKDETKRCVLNFGLTKLSCKLTERPGSDGFGVEFSLEDLHLKSDINNVNLIQANSDKILWCNFQFNPFNVKADYSLQLSMEPLNVTYDQTAVNSVKDFFTISNQSKLQELSYAATGSVKEISVASRAGIEFAVDHNKVMFIDIKMKCPIITVPVECKSIKVTPSLLHVNLGILQVLTNLNSDARALPVKNATDSELETIFYYQIDVNLTNIHVAVLDKSIVPAEVTCAEEKEKNFVLAPTSINVQVHRSLKSGYANFPDLKMFCTMSALDVCLSNEKCCLLYQVINNIAHIFANTSSLKPELDSSSRVLKDGLSKKVLKKTIADEPLSPICSDEEFFDAVDQPSNGSVFRPFNRTKIVASFAIEKLAINFEMKCGDGKEYLHFALKGIACDIKVNMWDILFKASLKSVQLMQLIQQERKMFLTSSDKKELIQVRYTQADAKGPEFLTKFNKVEHLFSAHLGLIKLIFVEEALLDLVKYFINLSSSIANEIALSSYQSAPIAPSKHIEVEQIKLLEKDPGSDMSKMDFRYEFSFAGIELLIQDLCNLSITDVEASISMNSCLTKYSFKLKDICFTDECKETKYSKILSVTTSEKLLYCKVTIINNIEKESTQPDMKINLQVGKLKSFFVPEFITQLVEMYNILMKIINYSSNATAPQAVNITDAISKIQLVVAIDAPYVYFPISRLSSNCFVIDLGHIDISSSNLKDENYLYEKLIIDAKDFSFLRNLDDIVLPISLQMVCKRSLNKLQQDMNILIQLTSVSVKIYNEVIDDAVTLYKNIYRILKSFPAGLQSSSTSKKTDFSFHANVDESILSISTSVECLLLTVSIQKLKLVSVSNSDTQNAQLSLKQIEIKEHLKIPITLLSSDENFMEVFYVVSNQEQNLNISVGQLLLLLDDSAINNIFLYASTRLKNFQEAFEFTNDVKYSSIENGVNNQPKTQLNINATLASLSVTWCYSDILLAITTAKDFVFMMHLKEKETSLKIRLKNLCIEDQSCNTLYTTIFLILDENLLAMEYLASEVVSEGANQQQNLLSLRVGKIKVVFLYKFIQDVMFYLQHIMDHISLLYTVKLDDKVKDISPGTFLQLDIDVASSLIIYPETSVSNKYLSANLDRCVVQNSLQMFANNITVHLSEMNISVHDKKIVTKVTDGLNAYLQIAQSVEIQSLQIDVVINPITVHLNEKDIQLLMYIFQANFNEKGKIQEQFIESNALLKSSQEKKKGTVNTAVNVNLKCETVKLVVSTCDLFKEKYISEQINICELCCSKLALQIHVSEIILVKMTLKELITTDIRPYSKLVFRKMFEQTSEDDVTSRSMNHNEENNRLVVSYSWQGNTQYLTVQVQSGTLLINKDFLNDFIAYLVYTFTPKPDYVVIASSELLLLRTTFEFPDLKIVLIQDTIEEVTNAIVVQLQSTIIYEQYKEKMCIQVADALFGIVLKEYPIKKKQKFLLLLQPCSVTSKVSLTNAYEIEVLIKKMIFCLSPSILTTIIHIADGIIGYQILQEKESVASLKLNTKVNWSPQLSNQDLLDQDLCIVPTDCSAPLNNVNQAGMQKFNLLLDAIELTLGNDLKGVVVPLLRFNICASTKVLDWSSKISIEGDYTIEASLFNDELATWEPVIELDEEQNDSFEVNIRSFYRENKKIDLYDSFSETKPENMFGDNFDHVDTKDAKKREIMHLVISSESILQLTITSKFLKVASLISEGFSMKSLRNPVKTELVAPYHFENQLGVDVIIWIEKTLKASTSNSSIQILQRSNTLAVGIESPSLSTYHLVKKSPSVRSKSSRMLNRVYSRTQENTETFSDIIDIQVSGFNLIKNVLMAAAGCFGYKLYPSKNGTFFEILVNVEILNGRRFITISSTIQIFNKLPMSVSVRSISGQELCIAEKNTSIPLEYFLIDEIKIELERNFPSEKMISLRDVKEKETMIKCKCGENMKYVNVIIKSELKQNVTNKSIVFAPPVVLINFLPITVVIYTQSKNTKGPEYFIESGAMQEIMDTNISKKTLEICIKCCDESGNGWIGLTNIKVTQRSYIEMSCQDKLRSSLMLETLMEHIDGVLKIRLFTSYWLVNKTGLNLQFRNSQGNLYNLLANQKSPTIISYNQQKKEKGNLSLLGGAWSDSFIMNVISDESVIKCKDSQQKEYKIHSTVKLSSFRLTYIITFSPTHLISNNTEFKLFFSEALQEPQWKCLEKMECSHIWLESALLLIKEENGAYLAPALPFDHKYNCVKRLSSSETVCVDVNKLGEKFVMKISSYQDGCIPLRIDNYCRSQSIFIEQKDTPSLLSTIEFLPNHSQYFTWKDLNKPKEILVFCNPYKKNHCILINPIQNTFGKFENSISHDIEDASFQSSRCCTISCFPCCRVDKEDNAPLISNESTNPLLDIYWVSYLDGVQRVLGFTTDFNIARKLRRSESEEFITLEVFVSLQGIGLSLINSVPMEIAYISITGGTSKWEVNSGKNWNVLDAGTSTLLEESWKNDSIRVNIKSKLKADFETMVMKFPYSGTLRRSQEPALWLHFTQSERNTSFHIYLQRLQVDSQQYDVIFPAVLYPTPLPPHILKRKGIKPFLEISVVFGSLNDTIIIRYLKVLLQEINLKLDRDIITGIMSLYNSNTRNTNELTQLESDMLVVQKTEEQLVNTLLGSHSSNLLLNYFHLSPVKIHLSFSIESHKVEANTNSELFEWLVSAIGIHFTDVSDIVIKLAFFERKNVALSRDILIAEASKHYLIQAAKQFHVLVLGLDVLGNPYGLISEYGEGFKDLFYEPYLGSVEGPHQFAEGLAYGVKSLLGHTVGGTVAAASLISEQFGQVVAAMSFDSEYKRKRKLRMQAERTGVGQEFAIGGKQFLLGLMYGISGLVTKPVQGARSSGINGFFKGVGKGLLGLLVKPASGVVDLLTTSLDGIRRFAEQDGNDVVCRVRLPRVTSPNKPIVAYSREHSYGNGLLKSLRNSKKIDGCYKDYVVVSDEPMRFVFFTTEVLVAANQKQFFDDWDVSFLIQYNLIKRVEQKETTVFLLVKNSVEMEVEIFQEVNCKTPVIANILVEKMKYYTTVPV